MEKTKKIKIFVGIFYLILVGLFLSFFFSKFSLQDILSYDFIKDNRDYFFEVKENNLFLLTILFILFTIIWVLAAGFVSPLGIVAGFVFGKWFGLLFLLLGMTFGSTALYMIANFFFKDLIKEKFLTKFQKLSEKFKESEFLYLLIFRFVGGIPFALQNVLPCIFNVKVSNYFWATFIGIIPQLFLICSIGSGLEKIIDQNEKAPRIIDIITSPDIYIPIIFFTCLVIISIFLRKFFYNK